MLETWKLIVKGFVLKNKRMKKGKIAYVHVWNCADHLIKAGMHQAFVWMRRDPMESKKEQRVPKGL